MSLPLEIWCCGCGRLIPTKQFDMNYNEHHKQKRHFYCKSCAKEISQNIMKKYCYKNNKENRVGYELAIREICTVFDMPYIHKAMSAVRDFELSSTKAKDWNYVYQYGCALKDLDYMDSKYWNNLSGNTLLSIDLFNENNPNDARPNSNGDEELLMGLQEDWGIQDSIDDYLRLETLFNKYSQSENLTISMENTMRYLCLAELEVMKKKGDKENNDSKAEEKKVMDYYKILGLDNFKLKENKTYMEKNIENDFFIMEEMEPLEWEDKNLNNRLGIDEDYEDIMRATLNKVANSKDYPDLSLEDVKKRNKK